MGKFGGFSFFLLLLHFAMSHGSAAAAAIYGGAVYTSRAGTFLAAAAASHHSPPINFCLQDRSTFDLGLFHFISSGKKIFQKSCLDFLPL